MTAVVRLLFDSRPAAVVGGIRTVVVDTVELMLRSWFASNVSEKVFVDFPSRANFDAASSPIFISSYIWIVAARVHSHPCAMFWRTVISVLQSSFYIATGFIIETAAGLAVSFFKVVANNNALVPAIATAKEE